MRRRVVAAATVAVPALGAAALTALASPVLPADLRVTAALGVAIAVGLGRGLHLPTVTSIGLLAVVVAVATGPAATAGPLALLGWVAATWGVVLTPGTGPGMRWPPVRDAATRWRGLAGTASCVALAIPLVVVVAVVDRAGRAWPLVGGLALVAGLMLVTSRPRPDRDATPASGGEQEA